MSTDRPTTSRQWDNRRDTDENPMLKRRAAIRAARAATREEGARKQAVAREIARWPR